MQALRKCTLFVRTVKLFCEIKNSSCFVYVFQTKTTSCIELGYDNVVFSVAHACVCITVLLTFFFYIFTAAKSILIFNNAETVAHHTEIFKYLRTENGRYEHVIIYITIAAYNNYFSLYVLTLVLTPLNLHWTVL